VALFAVSVDPPEVSKRLQEHLKTRITFLADPDAQLLDALGIRHRGGRSDGADIAFPTAILVDGSGVVRWTYQSETYRQRARPEDIFAALETLPVAARAP
jgi:peroxiredoxin